MKILILAVGKSGTTALLHKIGATRPDLQLFSGGKLDKVRSASSDAVFKFTLSEHKGRSIENFREHLSQTEYDRKIWIARDPRDNAISRMLFRWYQGSKTHKGQYHSVIDLVEKKEKNPAAVSFCELMRFRIQRAQPVTLAEVIEIERRTFDQLVNFVSGLGNDWHVFKYEDLVDNNFARLNEYLGFEIKTETNIDRYTKKVARKKSTGDWRHWYTEEDVKLFGPVYARYMELIGYDCNDWALHEKQVIEPEYASLYLKRLPHLRRNDSFQKTKKIITDLLSKIRKG